MRRVLLLLAAALSAFAQKVDFNREIRPILSDNCFACHGPDDAKRKATLTTGKSINGFGKNGRRTFKT